MGEMIQYRRPDGQSAPGYFAAPPGGAAAGIVVIQEWWGLSDQIRATADRIAGEGYRVLMPDLYRGKVARSAEEANGLMSSLDWAGAAHQDVRGALQHLAAGGAKKVGVLGFCMGGALTLAVAATAPEAAAAVCFYGIPPDALGDPRKIRVPLLAHFAQHDDWCTPEAVDALEAKLKAGGVPHVLHRYDAKHAFCNDKRPEVYHPEASRLAWERTWEFLRQNLA